MQHAGGSPLPPHQPGHGPATGWPSAAHHPGPHPGAHPDPLQGAAPVPPAPPVPGYQGVAPGPHAPHPPAAGRGAPVPSPGPVPPPGPQVPPPAPPVPDVTGHVQLPPGGPVAVPSVPPAQTAPDPTTTTLAVLLIGPAGAGKTSVAQYWAETRRVPTAHISLDDVREWVRSGFADPQSGWNDHSEAQYRLARRTCGFAARNFLANGISCILDDAVFPDRPVVGLGGWKRHVGPGLLPIVLLPGLDVVLERNAERSGNRRLSDEEVARIHGRMAGWYGSGLPIIDNSQLDVPATARLLDEALARAIASPPQW
ncbi:Pro-rich N-terminal domain-containing protein [Streptomyces tropicalis]|uniref:Pro-rich N-terminal domain-containing protein n=1 Tax=Streptomyces tropicalis TaxID=3034234 RepID=A0ABT6A4X6_9ACTN|nr:Pro-rich N-terminal domain-containing protein [Streptomyces tropicalis]MDF3299699.1 Pro-rich N-terminal domain-containing protein [Streptomyces tropicalis]